MRFLSRCLLALCLGLPAAQADTDAPLRAVWDGHPLDIQLTVGQERKIVFPADIWADIDLHIDERLRTTIVNNTLYLLATAPFAQTRISIGEEQERANIYLADISAGVGEDDYPDLIVLRETATTQKTPAAGAARRPDLTALIRFAARERYAPERLRVRDSRISRVEITGREAYLYRGRNISTVPLASWRSGDIYVTALKAENLSRYPLRLKNTRLRGRFLMSGFQHYRLGPKGADTAATTLYVVTRGPFWENAPPGSRQPVGRD